METREIDLKSIVIDGENGAMVESLVKSNGQSYQRYTEGIARYPDGRLVRCEFYGHPGYIRRKLRTRISRTLEVLEPATSSPDEDSPEPQQPQMD